MVDHSKCVVKVESYDGEAFKEHQRRILAGEATDSMNSEHTDPKCGPGRPPRPIPVQIDASPEEVARMLVTTPAKKDEDWRYLKPKGSTGPE